jgi:hypothetical protein
MPTLSPTPRLLKGGIILIDPETSAVQRAIVLQYNPDSLSRSLQAQSASVEGGDRSEVMRLKGPPVETIKLEAELDAADQLDASDLAAAALGLHPQLAALETIVYPTSRQLLLNDQLARSGTLEIAPMEAPLCLFIWSKTRILPVRLTDFSVTEEAFDTALNPIRARVSLGLRVLSVNDLNFNHKGSSLFLSYHQQKERLAALGRGPGLSALGIGGLA